MSTLTAAPGAPSTGITGQPVSTRALSLDIFRGFTMAVMIFVNDLSEIKGLPAWTYHYPRDVDAMSYVDMVFPFFLFAVGLSLPLAVRQRLKRDPSQGRLWLHIVQRCLALLVLGLVLANAQRTSQALTHMRGSAWATLALCGGILLWAVYPRDWPKARVWALRGVGAAVLFGMLALFRAVAPDGHATWLNFRYPEILGLIGLTYLATCVLYTPTRGLRWAPWVWFAALVALNCAFAARWLPGPPSVYVTPFGNGAMPSIVMAGIVVSGLFFGGELPWRRAYAWAVGFALLCATLGLFCKPLGISKIRATPSWALWSVAAATALFTLFYFLLDDRGIRRWTGPFRAPGSNTLLTYLLPDLTYYVLALLHLSRIFSRWGAGGPGVLKALCFTAVMLVFSFALTRARVRMQL